MLPTPLFTIAQFSPFTYLIYFPVKVYLGQLSPLQIILGMGIAFGWIILLYLFTKFIWKKGLKEYTAQGR
jgi:ABC-2 type transport system permease protein